MYVLKFEGINCWIANFDGDPGRTLIKEDARIFETTKKAENFKKRCLKKNSHRRFNLIIEER